jgi:hypothetical protein
MRWPAWRGRLVVAHLIRLIPAPRQREPGHCPFHSQSQLISEDRQRDPRWFEVGHSRYSSLWIQGK